MTRNVCYIYLNGLLLVPLLVLGVHGHELEHEQVEGRGDDGQAEHDEEERKRDVLRLGLQAAVLLQGDVVTEPDGGQGGEAVVQGVEKRPTCGGERERRKNKSGYNIHVKS